MPVENYEKVLTQLDSLRANVEQLAGGAMRKSSSWSAHANWKSSALKLPGEYSLTSRLAHPVELAAQVQAVAADMKNERFLEITSSLCKMLESGK